MSGRIQYAILGCIDSINAGIFGVKVEYGFMQFTDDRFRLRLLPEHMAQVKIDANIVALDAVSQSPECFRVVDAESGNRFNCYFNAMIGGIFYGLFPIRNQHIVPLVVQDGVPDF